MCSLGTPHDTRERTIGFSYGYGRSGKADDLTFVSIQSDFSYPISESFRLVAAIPWTRQSGPLGSSSGIGDVTLLLDHELLAGEQGAISVQVGGKVATGSDNDAGLPQRYQAGLGSNDLLLGVSYRRDPWHAAIGYQIAGGRNDNDLEMLKRGDDFLARVGYSFHGLPFRTTAEILAVKRLGKSSVRNPLSASADSFIDIAGSDQFQANILGSVVLPTDSSYALQLMAALPLLNRNINVDGLTRTFTFSAGITYSF